MVLLIKTSRFLCYIEKLHAQKKERPKDFKKQVLRNQLVPEELPALWEKSQWKLKAI